MKHKYVVHPLCRLLWKSLSSDKFITVKVSLRQKCGHTAGGGHYAHTHTHTHILHSQEVLVDLYNVTRCQDASSQLSSTEGICSGEAEGWVWGIQTGCWSQPWIYVSVTEPFMRRLLPLFFRGSCLFATEAAVQISVVLVHLLPLWDCLPPFWFPTLHRYILHLSNTQRKTDTQWGGHFSFALALHWCPDTG